LLGSPFITQGTLGSGSNGGGLETAKWARKTNGALVVLAKVHRPGLARKEKQLPPTKMES
jgi:hypothetical protein